MRTDVFAPAYTTLVVATKSRSRYWDGDAVRVPYSENTNARTAKGVEQVERTGKSADRGGNWPTLPERNNDGAGAPLLDWWLIPDETVVERLVLSMCPRRVCRICGEPSRRIVRAERFANGKRLPEGEWYSSTGVESHSQRVQGSNITQGQPSYQTVTETLGWSECACHLEEDGTRPAMSTEAPPPVGTPSSSKWRPGVVYDPFQRNEHDVTTRFLVGDVFDGLATIPDNSVDLIVSSPPFLALRSYLPADHPDKGLEIGSEATPGAFLDKLLDVVEACARVLAPHGSLVFELGDTYAGSNASGWERLGARAEQDDQPPNYRKLGAVDSDAVACGAGWPLDKSKVLVPQLFAIALAYGFNPLTGRTTEPWRVRNTVAWCRPNPPVGRDGDKFRPATSFLTVATKARDRYWDGDAVRGAPNPENARPNSEWNTAASRGHESGERHIWRGESTGAPLLDYWQIPTEPSTTGARTVHRVRVPSDADVGGIQRTTSPDCPVHGSPDHPGSSAPDDERGDSVSSRSARSDSRRVQEQQGELLPTPSSTDRSDSNEFLPDPAASRRSTASNRTGPVPATSPAGTPSARTVGDTERTSTSPASSVPDHDTAASNTGEDGSPDPLDLGTPGRIDGSEPESAACTCSYYVDISIAQNSRDYAPKPGAADYWIIPTEPVKLAHYATFPRALVVPLVKSMCPQKVCRVCGEPSRRIESDKAAFEFQPRLAAHIKQRREALGLTSSEINGWFGYKEVAKNWERTDRWGAAVPNASDWPLLKERLGLSDEFDALVLGERRWTESLIEYDDLGSIRKDRAERVHESPRPVYNAATRVGSDRWSDCGHDDYRAGMCLDPFCGSGTTLAVASGHGLDSIGIDLDARNSELAAERVGGLFLEITELRGAVA